jgi:hypothetical protein
MMMTSMIAENTNEDEQKKCQDCNLILTARTLYMHVATLCASFFWV